jgi:hypothetical protein
MEGTITIKFGSFEVSCTGSESFIEKSFPLALKNAKEVFLELGLPLPSGPETVETGDSAPETKYGTNGTSLTVSTICAKLKANSGPDLVMAACFSLHRQGRVSASRKEIIIEMRSAASYFKQTYINNLSANLKNLVVGGKLLEQAKDVFAIDAATIGVMESQLGLN